jgi:hypothetical protein
VRCKYIRQVEILNENIWLVVVCHSFVGGGINSVDMFYIYKSLCMNEEERFEAIGCFEMYFFVYKKSFFLACCEISGDE